MSVITRFEKRDCRTSATSGSDRSVIRSRKPLRCHSSRHRSHFPQGCLPQEVSSQVDREASSGSISSAVWRRTRCHNPCRRGFSILEISAPSFLRSGATIPSSCLTSAARRWTGSTSVLFPLKAISCPADSIIHPDTSLRRISMAYR